MRPRVLRGEPPRARRKSSQVWREKADIERAQEELESLPQALAELEQQFEAEVRSLELSQAPGDLQLQEVLIRPRKSDLEVRALELHWAPYFVSPTAAAAALSIG